MLNILFIYFNHYHNSKALGFIYFVGLKNTPLAIGLCGPMSSSGLTSPKQIRAQQSHTSKRHVATRKKSPSTPCHSTKLMQNVQNDQSQIAMCYKRGLIAIIHRLNKNLLSVTEMGIINNIQESTTPQHILIF